MTWQRYIKFRENPRFIHNILRIGQIFLLSVICNILLLHENAHNGAWWGYHTPRRSIYPEHKGKSRDSLFYRVLLLSSKPIVSHLKYGARLLGPTPSWGPWTCYYPQPQRGVTVSPDAKQRAMSLLLSTEEARLIETLPVDKSQWLRVCPRAQSLRGCGHKFSGL